ncbi:MAG TPA: FliM/FliN family flagellar motor switch protein [Longimicrobiales bacterium]
MGEAAERKAGPAGASSGTAPAVQLYDFRQPSRISKDRLRSLRAIYGMMAKAVESWLTGRVRGQVELDVTSVDQRGFGELVLSMPSPCCSYVYDVADSGGQQILIDFDANLCFFLLDRLLGGSGEGPVPPRPLTLIERSVVRIVADRVAAELVESWKEHVRLALTLSRFESIPDMLQIANREEPILVTELRLRAGEVEGTIRLCLPFAVLEKFFGGASQRRLQAGRGSEEERAADRQGVESAIRASRVQVCARLPLFEVRLGTLMRLRPGDVLETGLNTDVAIEVLLNGQDRLRARAGRVGRRLGLQILDWVGPGDGQPSMQTTRGRSH